MLICLGFSFYVLNCLDKVNIYSNNIPSDYTSPAASGPYFNQLPTLSEYSNDIIGLHRSKTDHFEVRQQKSLSLWTYIPSVYFAAILNRSQAKSLRRGLLHNQKSSTLLQRSLPLLFLCTAQCGVCGAMSQWACMGTNLLFACSQ